MTKKTMMVAGISLQLDGGAAYLASRSRYAGRWAEYSISIIDSAGCEVVKINGLELKAANAFLATFNNGPISLAGRTW